MSRLLEELDLLLADPRFLEDDLFMKADELAPWLDDQDWEDMRRRWSDRSQEWRGNVRSVVNSAVHPGIVSLIFSLLASDDQAHISDGYHLFLSMAPQEEQIHEEELNVLAGLWRTRPEWREQLEQAAWCAGKSGQLRRLLGFERWSDGIVAAGDRPADV